MDLIKAAAQQNKKLRERTNEGINDQNREKKKKKSPAKSHNITMSWENKTNHLISHVVSAFLFLSDMKKHSDVGLVSMEIMTTGMEFSTSLYFSFSISI